MFAESEDLMFNPELCRNETEVESKLIVQYLLPKLGYTPDNWFQEVSFGSIRLDFLAFATQVIPFTINADSPLSLVLEAKHPKENLDNHIRRLKRYLVSLNVRYGLLTNGKLLRIYERRNDSILKKYECKGGEIYLRIAEIRDILSREKLRGFSSQPKIIPLEQKLNQPIPLEKREKTVKTIAVYHNKGGVGKTTTVVNLAAAISKKGIRVLVIDLDSQANTTFATGLVKFEDEEFDDIKELNILQILMSEDFDTIEEMARKSNFCDPSIDVVPAHIGLMEAENTLNQLDYSRMILIEKLKQVEEKYDVVIIDTPPSLNLYARIALIACDYLIIPSDLKPFANQGLINVNEFIKKVNGFRKQIKKKPIEILGVLANKISSNAKFTQYSLPARLERIKKYDLKVMDSVIYDRDDLAKCAELTRFHGNIEIQDPKSIFEFKPDSQAAHEFEKLADEVLKKIGIIE
jgi:cellulose biosynthesis protein BcsQ